MTTTQICIKCDQSLESLQSERSDLLPHSMHGEIGDVNVIRLHTGERVHSEGRGSDGKDQREEKGLGPET